MQPSLTNLRPDSASQCDHSSLLAKNYREGLIHGQPEQVLDGVDALVDARLDEVSHVLQCKKSWWRHIRNRTGDNHFRAQPENFDLGHKNFINNLKRTRPRFKLELVFAEKLTRWIKVIKPELNWIKPETFSFVSLKCAPREFSTTSTYKKTRRG